jgi:hypothetical protein
VPERNVDETQRGVNGEVRGTVLPAVRPGNGEAINHNREVRPS